MNKCNGCSKKCEYGFVKLGCGGFLPQLGDIFYTVYFDISGNAVVLSPNQITQEAAIAEAIKIAQVCQHNTKSK